MSDEMKFGIGGLFVFTVVVTAVSIGAYNSSENEYREKALQASTELAKARIATEPLRAYNERLDEIMSRLGRIERAISIREKP